MVGAGFLMLALAAWALILTLGKPVEKLPPRLRAFFSLEKVVDQRPLLLKALALTAALPYLATTTGWLMTEVGRSPWVVYGLMKVDQAISPNVTAGMVLTSLIGFAVVYGGLMAADVYLLAKYATAGLVAEEK